MNLKDLKTLRERNIRDYDYSNEIGYLRRFFSHLTKRKLKHSKNILNKKRRIGLFNVILSVCLAALMVVISYGGYFYYQRYQNLKNIGIEGLNVFDPIKIAVGATRLYKESPLESLRKLDDRTNVLIVGIDARFDGSSWLTDTIIMMSYDHKNNSVLQISIPRDMRVKFGNVFTKVNSVFPFTYANKKAEKVSEDEAFKASFEALTKSVEEVTGMQTHYGVMVNFQGFKEIIDILGGIEINVENSFTDYNYPNDDGSGVITVSFRSGWQKMDGKTALRFVRSRHGNNGEGSDFARSRRQQLVINRVREKFINSNFFNQVDSLNKILETISQNLRFYLIDSNTIQAVINGRDLLKTLRSTSIVLDPNIGSYYGQLLRGGDLNDGVGWVVYPTKENFSDLIEYIKFIIDNTFLLEEKASVMLIYTNSNRYLDYTKLRNLFFANYLNFEHKEGWIRVSSISRSNITASTSEITPFVSIYSKGEINNTLAFYKSLLEKNNISYQIRSEEELPKELKEIFKQSNILFVVD